VHVQVLAPLEYSTLSGRFTTALREVAVPCPSIERKGVGNLSRTLAILPEARAQSRFEMTLALYVDDASPPPPDDAQESTDVLAEVVRITVQISERYQHNISSGALMVVNSETSPNRIAVLRHFLWTDLKLTADRWDVNLQGGLRVTEGDEDGKLHGSELTHALAANFG
jgi:hypothetical protein